MPSDRDTVRSALLDAIDWQEGLADAFANCRPRPEYDAAKALVKRYRALLKRRYGIEGTPQEKALSKGRLVTVEDLLKEEARDAE